MALFKVYYGDKDSLPEEIKDGYGYVVINEEANIGTWYIDVNPDNNENGKRYEISAAELVDEEGNFYTLDDIALIANLKADILDAIYDGQQEISLLDANERRDFRAAIQSPSRTESITKSYTMSISNSQGAWTLDGSFYKQTVNLSSGEVLQCGADNTTPPIIIWDRTTGSENIFSTISKAEVNNDRNAITFYVPVGFFNQFTGNLGVIIIDHR